MLRSFNQDIYSMAVEFNTAASCIMDLSNSYTVYPKLKTFLADLQKLTEKDHRGANRNLSNCKWSPKRELQRDSKP